MSEIESLLSKVAAKYQALERLEARHRACVPLTPLRSKQAERMAAERAALLAGLRVLVLGEVPGPAVVEPPEA